MTKFASDVDAANALAEGYKKLKNEISNIVIGQEEVVKQLITSIFCQ
jgi:MoxR-like ATPase